MFGVPVGRIRVPLPSRLAAPPSAPVRRQGTFFTHFRSLRVTPAVTIGVVTLAVACVVWIEDGAPDRRESRRALQRLLETR
jgi:hypothetical protein